MKITLHSIDSLFPSEEMSVEHYEMKEVTKEELVRVLKEKIAKDSPELTAPEEVSTSVEIKFFEQDKGHDTEYAFVAYAEDLVGGFISGFIYVTA